MSQNNNSHISTVSKGLTFIIKNKQALMLFNIAGQGEVSTLDIKIPSKSSIVYFIIDDYTYRYSGSNTTYQYLHFVKEFPTQPVYVYFIGTTMNKVDLISYNKTTQNGIYTFQLNDSQKYSDITGSTTTKEVFLCGKIKFNKNFIAFVINSDSVDTSIQYYYVVDMFL